MALLTTARLRSRLAVDAGAVRDKLAARANSTPGRLTVLVVVLGLLGVLAGISAVVGAAQRSHLVDSVATHSGPLAVQAQQLYRSLSDADATAAAAFLSSGAEPPELRQRYQSDIAAAGAALAAAGATGDRDKGPLAEIANSLPVYTGLVESARSYNRLNLPVGAAYLREASGVMRERLLPAARQLYQVETDNLADDRSSAAQFPWLTVPLILLTLAGLVVAQLYLTRRTRRLLNLGLATATAAGLVLLLWVGLSWLAVASHLGASDQNGSAQVQLVAQARIAALQARADEALTLVARGSGGAFADDFVAQMAALAGSDGNGGFLADARGRATEPAVRDALADATAAVASWRQVHDRLKGLDDGGQYPEAVKLAVGTDDGSTATVFNRVDERLAAAIATANKTFGERADRAGGALTGAGFGWTVLTLVLVAGVIVGLQQRIAEYR